MGYSSSNKDGCREVRKQSYLKIIAKKSNAINEYHISIWIYNRIKFILKKHKILYLNAENKYLQLSGKW